MERPSTDKRFLGKSRLDARAQNVYGTSSVNMILRFYLRILDVMELHELVNLNGCLRIQRLNVVRLILLCVLINRNMRRRMVNQTY